MQLKHEAGAPPQGGEIATATIPYLEIRNIQKSFGGVRALKGVSLSIEPGQIYHLMGENGCGKSTLIKIISGAQPADGGELLIDGKPVGHLTPVAALAAGIETVYQDFSLLPNLSVAENVGLTQQLVAASGKLARRLDLTQMRQTAERALAAVNLPTSRAFLSTRTDELPMATRQLIAIARAIASDARLVIMDEPTTALTKHEVDNLIGIVTRLRAKGVAVLFVTHKLDECKEIGGRAVIMRDGQKVAECDIADHTKAELGFWMTGKVLDEARYRSAPKFGDDLLSVDALSLKGAFANVSFSMRRGEIVGITGLLDSGRNELARAIAGVVPADAGRIRLDGKDVTPRKPADAIDAGIGYVPEDRLSEGLFLEKPIEENIVVPVLDRLRGAFGILDGRRSRELAKRSVADLQVVTPDVANPVQSLSGGNQQRVLIGRWLTINPKLLVLHGPTVGVDVGSKDTIYRIIQRLADEGMGVIIISDDLLELLQNCDRIMVMRKGEVVETFEAETLKEEALYRALVEETTARTPQ
ncbi:sugar ABC transporter ATP-binding protein [Ensifer sp. HO-A22]|uniref:Sugar ABC transporter ATP-binding protein n=1 Tax=Ensifer oleiphilus TaxID=2742698 RepID=A0A7Y6QAY6_9HYPH|nr:sugar ABC transporter ATP-binding protein [Ensifer oleiphilus]NVD42320.1 sugar ABC transporter ATP-binding protein [Ensifer oleiphilus]